MKYNILPKHVDCHALKMFELELWNVIKRVEFRRLNNNYQDKLKNIKSIIRDNPNLIVESDKTSNYYEVTKESYERILNNEITKTYKR